jgi:tetratricopeptide (TPR) repeat protein
VALAPQSAECWYNRGQAHAQLGRTAEALEDYDTALSLDARLAPALLNRGVLHYQGKRYAQALADLQAALDTGLDPAVGWYNIAVVQLAQGNREEARSSVKKALERSPMHQPSCDLDARLRTTGR